MDLDCLWENVSISRLHDFQKLANICIFCKYYYFSLSKHWPIFGGRPNEKLIHFPINNQNTSKILKIFELKVYLKKNLYIGSTKYHFFRKCFRKKLLNISSNFFFYLKVQSLRLIMENYFIQMAASAGHAVAIKYISIVCSCNTCL